MTPDGLPPSMDAPPLHIFWFQLAITAVVIAVVRCVWREVGFPGLRKPRNLPVGQHLWTPCTASHPVFCNACRGSCVGLVDQAFECDTCGVISHGSCRKKCVNAVPCKWITTVVPHQHQWLQGNLHPLDVCKVCGEHCASMVDLDGVRCVWCHTTVHNDCLATAQACELPPALAAAVIPPQRVQPKPSSVTPPTTTVKTLTSILRRKSSNKAQATPALPVTVLDFPKTYDIIDAEQLTPLVVFVNTKSGGHTGAHALHCFRRALHPIQVYDLGSGISPALALSVLSDCRVRVLACGGDGTVSWIIQELYPHLRPQATHTSTPQPHSHALPPIAILPLGTGNDLARVLGWGSGRSGEVSHADALAIIDDIMHHTVPHALDLWHVSVTPRAAAVQASLPVPRRRRLGAFIGGPAAAVLLATPRHAIMMNYMCVGVGAKIALEFHCMRESHPQLFFSRLVNKVWYTQAGGMEILRQSCANLREMLTVEVDGVVLALPEGIEGVVALNIGSYAGGGNLWGLEPDRNDGEPDRNSDIVRSWRPPANNDGTLEIVGVTGSFQLAQLQVGLSSGAVRLAQCNTLKLTLTQPANINNNNSGGIPMQIDGEPWNQACPCEITISCAGQATMLQRHAQ